MPRRDLPFTIDLTEPFEEAAWSPHQLENKRLHFAAVSKEANAGESCSGEDQEGDLADSNHCCICSDRWCASGSKRVVALKKCGHLFCLECILEWLRVQKPAVCPICRQRCVHTSLHMITVLLENVLQHPKMLLRKCQSCQVLEACLSPAQAILRRKSGKYFDTADAPCASLTLTSCQMYT